MGRTTQYHYDPVTKKWTTSTSKTDKKPSKPSNSSKTGKTTKKTGNSLTGKHTNPKSPAGKVEKKQNQKVYYTLTAGLSTLANDQTIKLKTGNTVKLNGFGKYLTGNYYIESQTINISSGGLDVSFNVLKNNFRKTIKKVKKKKTKK